MINVILADHQKIFRIGMASSLAVEDDIRIVGQPHSVDQLMCGMEKFSARVLVLSSAFLGKLDEIKRAAAGLQTAILLLAEKGDDIPAPVSQQVQGVVQRSASPSTIVQCIRHLARGGRVVRLAHSEHVEVAPDSVGIRVRQRLTQLELKIIALVVQGHRNREIALQLGATEQGVKNALRKIFDKTGVFDRLELALFVVNHQSLATATIDAHPYLAAQSAAAMQATQVPGWRPTVN